MTFDVWNGCWLIRCSTYLIWIWNENTHFMHLNANQFMNGWELVMQLSMILTFTVQLINSFIYREKIFIKAKILINTVWVITIHVACMASNWMRWAISVHDAFTLKQKSLLILWRLDLTSIDSVLIRKCKFNLIVCHACDTRLCVTFRNFIALFFFANMLVNQNSMLQNLIK